MWWWWWYLIWHLAVRESCWFQTTVEPPLTANSPQWPPLYNLCPGGQAINCFLFKPLNNGHLLTTATVPLKHVPNCQFFQWVMKKSRMIMTFDPYYALMINRGNHILIVFHVYCCSKHKLSTILLRTLQTLLILSCSYFDPEHYQSLFVYFTSICLLSMIGLPLWDTVNAK